MATDTRGKHSSAATGRRGRGGKAAATSETTDAPATGRRAVTRLTADLPTADSELLGKVAADLGTTKVTALVRAIRVLARLVAGQGEGERVILERPDGSRTELQLL